MGTFVATVGVLCAVVYRYYPDKASPPLRRRSIPPIVLTRCSHQQQGLSKVASKQSSEELLRGEHESRKTTGHHWIELEKLEHTEACIYSN